MHEVCVWVPFEPWWVVVVPRVQMLVFLVEPRSNRSVPEVSLVFREWLESQTPWHPLPRHSLAQVSECSLSKGFQLRREEGC